MQRLIIVGAGGYGREMYLSARESRGFGEEFEIAGFLDDNPDALGGRTGYPPVIGSVAQYAISPDDVFIVAIGDLSVRRRCAATLAARGARFRTLVHRNAQVGATVRLGEGVFVASGAVLTADVSVGAHTAVFHQAVIGHDVTIGEFAHVYALCAIGGGVEIGDGAAIYPGARIVPRRRIGKGAVVAIGSVVFRSVPAGARVAGNPAFLL